MHAITARTPVRISCGRTTQHVGYLVHCLPFFLIGPLSSHTPSRLYPACTTDGPLPLRRRCFNKESKPRSYSLLSAAQSAVNLFCRSFSLRRWSFVHSFTA